MANLNPKHALVAALAFTAAACASVEDPYARAAAYTGQIDTTDCHQAVRGFARHIEDLRFPEDAREADYMTQALLDIQAMAITNFSECNNVATTQEALVTMGDLMIMRYEGSGEVISPESIAFVSYAVAFADEDTQDRWRAEMGLAPGEEITTEAIAHYFIDATDRYVQERGFLAEGDLNRVNCDDGGCVWTQDAQGAWVQVRADAGQPNAQP